MTLRKSLPYIIIDSNAWITFFSYKAKRGDLKKDALKTERSDIASNVRALIDGNGNEHLLLMPTPVYAELLGIFRGKGKTCTKRKRLVDSAVDFLENIDFLFVELDEKIAKDSEEYIKKHDLCGIDASIIAMAVAWEADAIYTSDKQMLKANGGVKDVLIEEPPTPVKNFAP